MSSNPTTLRESFDFNLTAGSIAQNITIKALKIREWVYGVKDSPIPADTFAATINATDDTKQWLASIIGAFDSDPIYAQIMENEREARKRMDEQFIIIE